MIAFVVLAICVCTQAEDTGYPAGLMADCPGMNRTTLLSEETKRSLSVVVAYPSTGLLGYKETRCKLSDGGVACAARHLDTDLRRRKTQVIISGYLDGSFSPFVRSLMYVYLSRGRNVIVLETFPILVRSYPLAARLTKPLGELLGHFLASLSYQGLSSRRLEFLGGSLGAHIASHAAVTYKHLTGKLPARITGLDPAGPCFRNVPPTARLHPDAARHVDVLHTNIDGFGIADPLGHVDFYANGVLGNRHVSYVNEVIVARRYTARLKKEGPVQDLSLLLYLASITERGEFQPAIKGDFIMPCFQLCSHIRSAFYWTLAYDNPDKFVAVGCNSLRDARHGNCYEGTIRTNTLGPQTNFSKTGLYYLPTDAREPYYLGSNGLKKRKFGVNDYLMTPAPDEDMTL